jgi:predicted TIM-barrel fold metal-dependent hydrolase
MSNDLNQFLDFQIIDSHVHLWKAWNTLTEETVRSQGDELVEILEKGNIGQIYTTGGDPGIYLKAKYPQFFYAGAPLPPILKESKDTLDFNWKRYIENLITVGYDGMGEMGSKPKPKKDRVPLDGQPYEGFWSTCEELNYPVLCHVGDPIEFWDEKLIPDWARTLEWGYYFGDFPSLKELYREMENVLNGNPRLKIVLSHFYFMSANLEAASAFLDLFANAHFDLSLGIELMFNISRRRDDWREFFIKYADRILYGTDIGVSQNLQQHLARIWLIRTFLESDKEFYTPASADDLLSRYEEPFVGLNLPSSVLTKIYSQNFQRLWGRRPKELNINAAISRCEREGNNVVANSLKTFI